MTDKEYEVEKKRIDKLFKKWRDVLGLGWWRITLEYEREEPEHEGKTEYAPKDIEGMWRNIAVTRCDPYYLRATIIFYLLQTKKVKDEELEETFIHECMHILLSSMHTKQTAAFEETVATRLAVAFKYLYEMKDKEKVK